MGFIVCVRSTVGDYTEKYRSYNVAHRKFNEYAIIFPNVDLLDAETGEVILTTWTNEDDDEE